MLTSLGTRQSYVPGGGHRTGPPGKHVVQGKAKFRIVDEQVRIFVPPPQDALQSTHVSLISFPGKAAR
jgi:large subunit ribosomal protein L41